MSWWSAIACAGVEIFTSSEMPVSNVPSDAVTVSIDSGEKLDDQISADLPDDPDEAEAVMHRRMRSPEYRAHAEQLNQAYTGLARAWILGIQKIPAVVVDERYVVYGQPDVSKALDEIQSERR
ncbi:hypothetical protein LMG33810_002744 [Carnimonas sp. LMG 33810]